MGILQRLHAARKAGSKPAQSTVTPVVTTPIVAEPVVPTPPSAPVVNEEPKESTTEPLKGVAARVVTNMEASLTVPTATSVRSIPAILLQENRVFINEHLARRRGGKVSFTHLIGFAVVKAFGLLMMT